MILVVALLILRLPSELLYILYATNAIAIAISAAPYRDLRSLTTSSHSSAETAISKVENNIEANRSNYPKESTPVESTETFGFKEPDIQEEINDKDNFSYLDTSLRAPSSFVKEPSEKSLDKGDSSPIPTTPIYVAEKSPSLQQQQSPSKRSSEFNATRKTSEASKVSSPVEVPVKEESITIDKFSHENDDFRDQIEQIDEMIRQRLESVNTKFEEETADRGPHFASPEVDDDIKSNNSKRKSNFFRNKFSLDSDKGKKSPSDHTYNEVTLIEEVVVRRSRSSSDKTRKVVEGSHDDETSPKVILTQFSPRETEVLEPEKKHSLSNEPSTGNFSDNPPESSPPRSKSFSRKSGSSFTKDPTQPSDLGESPEKTENDTTEKSKSPVQDSPSKSPTKSANVVERSRSIKSGSVFKSSPHQVDYDSYQHSVTVTKLKSSTADSEQENYLGTDFESTALTKLIRHELGEIMRFKEQKDTHALRSEIDYCDLNTNLIKDFLINADSTLTKLDGQSPQFPKIANNKGIVAQVPANEFHNIPKSYFHNKSDEQSKVANQDFYGISFENVGASLSALRRYPNIYEEIKTHTTPLDYSKLQLDQQPSEFGNDHELLLKYSKGDFTCQENSVNQNSYTSAMFSWPSGSFDVRSHGIRGSSNVSKTSQKLCDMLYEPSHRWYCRENVDANGSFDSSQYNSSVKSKNDISNFACLTKQTNNCIIPSYPKVNDAKPEKVTSSGNFKMISSIVDGFLKNNFHPNENVTNNLTENNLSGFKKGNSDKNDLKKSNLVNLNEDLKYIYDRICSNLNCIQDLQCKSNNINNCYKEDNSAELNLFYDDGMPNSATDNIFKNNFIEDLKTNPFVSLPNLKVFCKDVIGNKRTDPKKTDSQKIDPKSVDSESELKTRDSTKALTDLINSSKLKPNIIECQMKIRSICHSDDLQTAQSNDNVNSTTSQHSCKKRENLKDIETDVAKSNFNTIINRCQKGQPTYLTDKTIPRDAQSKINSFHHNIECKPLGNDRDPLLDKETSKWTPLEMIQSKFTDTNPFEAINNVISFVGNNTMKSINEIPTTNTVGKTCCLPFKEELEEKLRQRRISNLDHQSQESTRKTPTKKKEFIDEHRLLQYKQNVYEERDLKYFNYNPERYKLVWNEVESTESKISKLPSDYWKTNSDSIWSIPRSVKNYDRSTKGKFENDCSKNSNYILNDNMQFLMRSAVVCESYLSKYKMSCISKYTPFYKLTDIKDNLNSEQRNEGSANDGCYGDILENMKISDMAKSIHKGYEERKDEEIDEWTARDKDGEENEKRCRFLNAISDITQSNGQFNLTKKANIAFQRKPLHFKRSLSVTNLTTESKTNVTANTALLQLNLNSSGTSLQPERGVGLTSHHRNLEKENQNYIHTNDNIVGVILNPTEAKNTVENVMKMISSVNAVHGPDTCTGKFRLNSFEKSYIKLQVKEKCYVKLCDFVDKDSKFVYTKNKMMRKSNSQKSLHKKINKSSLKNKMFPFTHTDKKTIHRKKTHRIISVKNTVNYGKTKKRTKCISDRPGLKSSNKLGIVLTEMSSLECKQESINRREVKGDRNIRKPITNRRHTDRSTYSKTIPFNTAENYFSFGHCLVFDEVTGLKHDRTRMNSNKNYYCNTSKPEIISNGTPSQRNKYLLLKMQKSKENTRKDLCDDKWQSSHPTSVSKHSNNKKKSFFNFLKFRKKKN